jgi:LysR family glycine cleavage system transcriptional activator
MFADSAFDCALYAGTPEQVNQWAGTVAVKLLDERVLPVVAPSLLQGLGELSPEAIAGLPLLQQSTRPDAWRQWFEAQGLAVPQALAGARFELFSMTAAAARQGMGLALVPALLVEDELSSGELRVACDRPLASARAYYLVRPERDENSPVTQMFLDWLLQAVRGAA